MTTNGDIDRQRLSEAVKLPNKGKLVEFAFGKNIPVDEINLNAFYIAELAEIQLPFSFKDAGQLKELCSMQKTTVHGQIVTTPNTIEISSMVICHLGLPDGMNIQAKLDKLIVHDTEDLYEHRFNSKKELGTFGTATLQLPVEGGHEGGNLKLKYKERSQMFDTTQNSSKDFYLSAYYNCCRQNVEPLTKGCKIMLVFSLIWTNSKMIISQDFPAFLTALKKTKKALRPWISNADEEIDKDVSDSSEEEEKESSDEDESCWEDVDSSDSRDSDDEDFDEEYEHCYMHQSDLEDNLLYFVLEEKYGENNLAFNRLRGNDRNLALLLQSCPFLDVHLAQVTLESQNLEYNRISRTATESGSHKISRWIDSNNNVRNLNMDINWKDQRVGPFHNLLSSRNMDPDRSETAPVSQEEDDGFPEFMSALLDLMQPNHGPIVPLIRTQYFFRGVLVIWPKKQSTLIYCRHGLPSLLDRMEESLSSTKHKEEAREIVAQNLEEIISFCCVEPNNAWKYATHSPSCDKEEFLSKKGELTARLLQLCIALEVNEEGLNLLRMLGTNFQAGSQFSSPVTYEGIQNDQVAKAIADFTSHVAGWDNCAAIIQQLITPTRIATQFPQIIKLAEYLLQANCLEGVKAVGKRISSSVASIPDFDVKLLTSFITSKDWAKMKSPMKLLVLNACTALVETSIMEMLRVVHSKQNDPKNGKDLLKLRLSKCMQLFILIEKNRIDDEQENATKCFLDLLAKLPTSYVMNLVLDLHKPEAKSPQNMKNFPTFMDWYRHACRILFFQDFVPLVSGDLAVNVVNCLLWLDDEKSWNSFSDKICAFFPSDESDLFVQVYLDNVDIQKALLVSEAAFASFNRIVNHWNAKSKTLKDPSVFSWEQPRAKVPDYPEVEAFLRSPEETGTFLNLFSDHEVARQFAKELEGNGAKNGCGVRVTVSGGSNVAHCTIVKLRNYHDSVVKDFRESKLVLQKFVDLHQRILQDRLGH